MYEWYVYYVQYIVYYIYSLSYWCVPPLSAHHDAIWVSEHWDKVEPHLGQAWITLGPHYRLLLTTVIVGAHGRARCGTVPPLGRRAEDRDAWCTAAFSKQIPTNVSPCQ